MTKTHTGTAPRHPEDVLLWSDGTWCYRAELANMLHMSDDYECILVDTERYTEFFKQKRIDFRVEPCSEKQNENWPL